MASVAQAMLTLSDEVTRLHQSVVRLRPDTWVERVRNVSLTCAGVLLSAASIVWLYDRLVAP
jgi:hypothetical protein